MARPDARVQINSTATAYPSIADEGSSKYTRESTSENVSLKFSETITLPGMAFNKKKPKSRLPGPLKLPKSYKPRFLSPMEEHILASRLSKVPERWDESYREEIWKSNVLVTKKVKKEYVDEIVARLSAKSKHEETNKRKDEENLFDFEKETNEEDEERKLDQDQVDKLVERLSQTSLQSDTKSTGETTKEQTRRRGKLTADDLDSLTERLSKPRSYIDPNTVRNKAVGRFVGRKMTENEITGLVQRIAYKGMKPRQKNGKSKRNNMGYFAVWTPCDADFRAWRIMNQGQPNEEYF